MASVIIIMVIIGPNIVNKNREIYTVVVCVHRRSYLLLPPVK